MISFNRDNLAAFTLLLASSLLTHVTPTLAGDAVTYPEKPVRVIVGLAAGGATDVQARWYAQKLTAALGRQFVIDNRAGAGGLIAYQMTAGAQPDGYTLVVGTPALTIAPALQDNVGFDPVESFAPIALLTKAPFVVVVIPSFAARSMKELIAFARDRPEALLMGVAGRTAIHLGAVWLAHATHTRMTIVTYKGNAPVITDILAGQVHATLANVLSAQPLLKSAKLRALAVTTAARSRALPELPTVAESGVPEYDVTTWHGWLAPRGTPPAVVARLNRALGDAMKSPAVADKLAEDGALDVAGSSQQFHAYLAQELKRWRTLVGAIQ